MKQKLFTRNFTFLILGQISSLVGNYTLRFALSMYVLEQTGSASIFAGLLALALLPTILPLRKLVPMMWPCVFVSHSGIRTASPHP